MGLKYIEPIKSIILLLLVLLSATFTFSIWTYTPRLDPIEPSSTVDISIGERKDVKDIIKPYKLLIKYDGMLKGTTNSSEIDNVLNEMSRWKVSQLVTNSTEMNKEQMKTFFQQPNQFTLYFQGLVPLPVYDDIVPIEDSVIPQFSFDRIVVRWNPREIAFDIHFINQASGLHYSGKVTPVDTDTMTSYRAIVLGGENFSEYAEVNSQESTYIAVPVKPVHMIRSTYYQEELSPTRFRDALFNDPNAVRRSQVNATHEEFGDDHALLTVNTQSKMLNFVHPAAESREPTLPSDLLYDVIESINEHGGWTDTFRFSYINAYSHYVRFQLFNNGYPVFSDVAGTTEIVQFFGENRVFRYIRPYYTLEVIFSEEMDLPAGTEIANALSKSDKLDFGAVEDITVGYMMRHDLEKRIFVMEPAWYYLMKTKWQRYSPEQSGGEHIGLE
ncbi:YycH family regulatory protein [Sporosarcina highlanderae]|uniref:Two-component system activity regulator YycH n=1 Tax=Sporosarcina highlanderae TaxID=3035916 RepID=A0ABT8JUR6_9BACL|nr:two-component system activity regulator YycH [Sporosarcina highlanderae]MDN4608919.1 two-component system activity regulator YycH [Sporosarcina highlanderae]